MEGTLSVTLPKFGFELTVEFTDARRGRYSIRAKTPTALNAAARHEPVKGVLKRGAVEIGKVDLQVDSDVVWEALPSFRWRSGPS